MYLKERYNSLDILTLRCYFQLWCCPVGAVDRRNAVQGDRCPGGGVRSGRQQTDPPHTLHLSKPLRTTHVW